jgi:hypothetical protein
MRIRVVAAEMVPGFKPKTMFKGRIGGDDGGRGFPGGEWAKHGDPIRIHMFTI